ADKNGTPHQPLLFPYTTLFRSTNHREESRRRLDSQTRTVHHFRSIGGSCTCRRAGQTRPEAEASACPTTRYTLFRTAEIRERRRSEEHTSELQSRENLVCRLLL